VQSTPVVYRTELAAACVFSASEQRPTDADRRPAQESLPSHPVFAGMKELVGYLSNLDALNTADKRAPGSFEQKLYLLQTMKGLPQMDAQLWNRFSTAPQTPDSLPSLSPIKIPDGEPNVENQISEAENRWISEYFQQFHVPMIARAGVPDGDLRMLEIGGGFGQLAYGTLNNVQPQYYIATDVFPALVSIMAENFHKWSKPNCASALLDPNDENLYIKKNSFNVIQSHSVLHHILHYQEAVKRLFDTLDTPGLMIFCEPCLDAHVYLQTLTKAFRFAYEVSPELSQQLGFLDIYIDQRSGADRTNTEFLSQFGAGDKYLYSIYDIQNLAQKIGARLYIQKDTRKARGNLEFEMKLRNATDLDLVNFREFLDRVLPNGVDEAYFSDLRQVFCLVKQ
jgi:SAM-dependent methyltransferase